MTQVILQPAGSQEAQGHYQDTIERPVPIRRLAAFLTPEEVSSLARLFPEGDVPTWGVTPGKNDVNRGKWERVRHGAVLLFARRGGVHASGTVVYKTHNKAAATELWGYDENGATWEYLYFIDQIIPYDIPYAAFNAAAGYEPNNVIQGFQVLADDVSDRILSRLELSPDGSVGGTLEDFEAATTIDADMPLDAVGQALLRKEQGFLRRQLFGRGKTGRCAICGKTLPTDLLVAAHIKKRSLCNEDEKRNYKANVVAMCTLGCDSLFERRYISVHGGVVLRRPTLPKQSPELEEMLGTLSGRSCSAWTPATKPFFAFHHELWGGHATV